MSTPTFQQASLANLWFGILLCLGVLATACGQGGAPSTADVPPEPGEASEVAISPEPPARPQLPATALPQEHGLFLVTQTGALREVPRGPESALHPTNAERGFGFESPQGLVISDPRPLFALWTGSLELSTLRLTRLDADALLPERWWHPVAPGRIAWLPNATVRLEAERVPDQPGMMRLRPLDSLAAGFYVLHDGALVGGRQKADVRAYFPFQVLPVEGDRPVGWQSLLTACLGDLERTLVDAHSTEQSGEQRWARVDRGTFARTQSGRLRHCASQLLAARLAATRDEAVQAELSAALVTLDTIANGPPWDAASELSAALAPTMRTAPLLEYWLELTALDLAVEAGRAAAGGDSETQARAMERLATLYALPPGQGAAATGRLLWVPFFLDPAWPRLLELSGRLATGLDASEELAQLIAAHRGSRLARFASRYPASPLRATVDAVVAGLPAEVTAAMSDLDLTRGSSASVQFGPVVLTSETPVDPAVTEAVDRWVRSRRKPLARCHERLGRRLGRSVPGLLLVKVTMVGTYLGGATSLQLAWPRAADGSRIELGDEAFVACIEEEALSGLPADLAHVQATLVQPIIFVDPQVAAALIR